MKANDIVVGGKYVARVSGKLTTVRVEEIREVDRQCMSGGIRSTAGKTEKRYDVTNLSTGRKTIFRSAAKFRHVAGDSEAFEGRLKRLAERGAAGLITAEEQDKQHAAILADEQQRRGLPDVEQSMSMDMGMDTSLRPMQTLTMNCTECGQPLSKPTEMAGEREIDNHIALNTDPEYAKKNVPSDNAICSKCERPYKKVNPTIDLKGHRT